MFLFQIYKLFENGSTFEDEVRAAERKILTSRQQILETVPAMAD